MPDDLLRYVSGPAPFSWWWLVVAALLIAVVIGWYSAVFALTAPDRRVRDLPVVGSAKIALAKRRYVRAVKAIRARHRSGDLAGASASAAISTQLRAFLTDATGVRAQYMQVADIAASDLRSAAPLLADLNDAQFNAASTVDVNATADAVEELIRAWN
ncbi:hypothetical protein [Mycolicibacterium confluentis]|uniref:Uncharacterized protein n=1 Tax=Mycolicibacterium confluentis TaxID=28047 RepID=A0A7I7XR12_9MYCO|nr:hypothetical protein [Mycolicibacterium confluentis]MCV7321040.1 hypothetical protein [Mycolicibacterium confluentis]ORV25928.1 hypothetical protein AWB99_21345 [Mycolicibacterium confluentis]BBZ31594.1 hypothetical protein MCNF_01990 [Mycolicibacterium confluentis]